jgi:hypothetical protein
MVKRELIEKFEMSDLYNIVDEFFTQHFWVDFANEVIGETSIPNVEEFTRNYCITQICDGCTKEELIESGWLFDDEGEEEEWVNNN